MTDVAETITQQLKEMGVDVEQNQSAQDTKIEAVEPAEEIQEDAEETQETNESVLSDIEQQALATGWNPDGPKSADEWVRTEP